MNNSVVVGLSGGVDSSVTALLLLEQGYDVRAVFMKNWVETTPGGECLWEQDVEDAMQVCDTLGIPLNTIDLSRAYWDGVFAHFLEEYRNGLTPNPDIVCNQEVKFKAFRDHVVELGASHLATGHYARCTKSDSGWMLQRGLDPNKDQSYFLCMLTQRQLEGTLFPVGAMLKSDVRKLAARAGLGTHAKKDSTGICFVGERPFREFLAQFLPVSPGEILDTDGHVIGEHEGVHFYTIGQRSGLGIGGIAGRPDAPWYVAAKDPATNTLIAVQGNHPLLFSRSLRTAPASWIAGQPPAQELTLAAKTRYRQPDQECTIEPESDGTLLVHFATPQRAVAPGQYAVFYLGETCLGGAMITGAES
ncbi:MAG: tRNA 2-thiouridine(34) synthase MnmA [Gammaproteobacteria bacterium RIFCSPLOWO2_02_FULL_61_13]|nr:MAG: tRNA 2-thiouridine(34) synthase MnmA [Gammaproteobacteria bacterium RIFCSPLOWO2_02_FULL_61_13]